MGQTRSSLSSSPDAPSSSSKRRSKRVDPDSIPSVSVAPSVDSPLGNALANDPSIAAASVAIARNRSSRQSQSGRPPDTGQPPVDNVHTPIGTANGTTDSHHSHAINDDNTSYESHATSSTTAPFYNPWDPLPRSASQFLHDMEQNSNFNQQELDRLRKRFMKLDSDGSGAIDREEFLQIPQIANNPLASRMIAIFDEDGGGTVDFQEFVGGLSAFSSRGGREEKLRFAFKVYDMDRDGFISNGELFLVLKMMVGNNLKDAQLQQIVDKTIMEADRDGDGKLNFEEFTAMVAKTDIVKQMTLEDLF